MNNQSDSSTDSNFFNVDAATAARMAGAMEFADSAVRLPFPAPTFSWMNGNPAAEDVADTKPALYFGGWRVRVSTLDEVSDQRSSLPKLFAPAKIRIQNDLTPCLITRLLVIAPIAFRQRWEVESNGRTTWFSKFPEGMKSNPHLQILAYLGLKQDDGSYLNWGEVLLSVRGSGQVPRVIRHMRDWKVVVDSALRKFAPKSNSPAWAFYMCLGSIGLTDKEGNNVPRYEDVGKQVVHTINPIELYQPKEVNVATLKNIFIGKANVEKMADTIELAKDWANTWKQPALTNEPAAPAAAGIPEPPSEFYDEDSALAEDQPF